MQKKQILLIGGGLLLIELAKELANYERIKKIYIITGDRHAKEIIFSGSTFEKECEKLENNISSDKIEFYKIKNLDEPTFGNVSKKCELVLSLSSPWIFKKKHIEVCKNLFNIHCSDLPRWAGGGGQSWRILAGINYSAVTVHKISEGVDAGDIVCNKKYFFPSECKTPKEFDDYTRKISFDLLKDFINKFLSEELVVTPYPQQKLFSSYFPRLNSSIHGCIDWSWNYIDLVKFIDAFDDPYCGAFSRINRKSEKVYLKKAVVIQGECNYHPYQAGIVFRKDENGIYICANGGAIYVSSILDFNKKNIFESISLGDRFYTSQNDLEKALSTRTIYSP